MYAGNFLEVSDKIALVYKVNNNLFDEYESQ